jgi:hypothetical protein
MDNEYRPIQGVTVAVAFLGVFVAVVVGVGAVAYLVLRAL